MADAEYTKFSCNLYPTDIARLRRLAAIQNINVTHALRISVALDEYLHDEVARGGQLMIQRRDGRIYELNFKLPERNY